MVLLGIDPGFLFAGFGVIKKNGRTTQLLEYGCLKMTSKQTITERIKIFHDYFVQKVEKWQVTDLVLETPFLGKNAQNFLKLGYLRGILHLIAGAHSLKLHEFSPREIKQAVTGFGGAQKDQVARVIGQLFPRLDNKLRNDVTDALAVALCGLWRQKNPYLG